MKALKMCLNWRVVAGVGLVAVGSFVFAPSVAFAALPFLVIAICPLSMLLMMALMNRHGREWREEDPASQGPKPLGAPLKAEP